jgi:hypothetical protein
MNGMYTSLVKCSGAFQLFLDTNLETSAVAKVPNNFNRALLRVPEQAKQPNITAEKSLVIWQAG